MSDICKVIGEVFCAAGGCLFALLLIGIFAEFVCNVWIEASNKFRRICKAESMIFEYRENKDKFIEWKRDKGVG